MRQGVTPSRVQFPGPPPAFKKRQWYNTSMTNAAKEVAYFLNNRPLCFLSTVFSIRDFVLGLAMFLALPDVTQTLLYANLQQLGGAHGAAIFGMAFMVIALLTAGTAVASKTAWTKFGLQAQAWWWLFACMVYLMNGNWILAIIFGLLASVPSGYLAFYYKYTPIWDIPKREWRARHGLTPLR